MTTTSLKRKVINRLDVPAMRWLLASTGSLAGKIITKADVQLLYDEMWIRRTGDVYFADTKEFEYYVGTFKVWMNLHNIWTSEPADIWFHHYQPQQGDVILDVGAGFGNDAFVFNQKMQGDGRIIAIEAHPTTFARLEKTCKWNNLSTVECVNVAISDTNGHVDISDLENDVLNHLDISGSSEQASIKIPAKTIDQLCSDMSIDKINLLKMNIEGAEALAIKGMGGMIDRIENAVISCHDFITEQGGSDFFTTKSQVTAFFQDAGFTVVSRDDNPRPYVRDTIYAQR